MLIDKPCRHAFLPFKILKRWKPFHFHFSLSTRIDEPKKPPAFLKYYVLLVELGMLAETSAEKMELLSKNVWQSDIFKFFPVNYKIKISGVLCENGS